MSRADPSPAPRWMRLLLFCSLGLNLLIIGLAVGVTLRFGGPEPLRGPPRSMGTAIIRELPHESRRAMFREVHEASRVGRRGQPPRDLSDFIAVLQRQPFDRAAAEAAIRRQAAGRKQFEQAMQQALLDELAAMNAEQRAAYAERLQAAARRHAKRKRHKPR